MNYSPFLEFCKTDVQRRTIQSVIDAGSVKKAAKALGRNTRGVERIVAKVKAAAAKQGWAPEADLTHKAATGFATKRVSTLYGAEGDVTAQWHIQEPDKAEQIEGIRKALADEATELFEPIPTIARQDANTTPDEDLINLIPITDYHMGMLAHAAECGADWDIRIADRVGQRAVHNLISRAPRAGTALFINLGDFLHYDSKKAVTPTSGHHLDTDTRAYKMYRTALRFHRRTLEALLATHPRVLTSVVPGNHDEYSAITLSAALIEIFSGNPRISVDPNVTPFTAYAWGDALLAFLHGHTRKMEKGHQVFSSDPRFRKMWGDAKYTFQFSGHLHTTKVVEENGAIQEQLPTMAARDSYAAEHGWGSLNRMPCITFHKKHLERSRIWTTLEENL